MEVKKYLEAYKFFIIEFEEAMREHYNFQDNLSDNLNILFESEGSIENYKYRFHGGGCEIIQNNIICDYDFANYRKDFNYEYSIWKLYVFIKTYFNIDIHEANLKLEIEELVKKGEIKKLIIDGRVYDVYFI